MRRILVAVYFLAACQSLCTGASASKGSESQGNPDLSQAGAAASFILQTNNIGKKAEKSGPEASPLKFRQDLNDDLDDKGRDELFEAMLPYVQSHAEEHLNAAHEGAEFYYTHIRMIHGLEKFLQRQGLQKFVPLPGWDPSKPAPGKFFSYVAPGDRKKLKEGIVTRYPENLTFPALCNFESVESLTPVLFKWHQSAHDTLGFTDPLFWNYHAFVLDTYERWKKCPGTAMPPESHKAPASKGRHH